MSGNAVAVIAITFTLLMTILGAAFVYCMKDKGNPLYNAIFSGFASGIMISASIWSLLLPSMQLAQAQFGKVAVILVCVGVLLGCVFIAILDILPIMRRPYTESECRNKKASKLFLAVTLHNVPEGLALGFALGGALLGSNINYGAAIGLALGIGLQNIPEGAAVSLPIYAAKTSRNKAFLIGSVSGLVETLFAFFGYFFAAWLQNAILFLPIFAAGAMLYVTMAELLPDIKTEGKIQYGVWSLIIGFLLMVALNIVFS